MSLEDPDADAAVAGLDGEAMADLLGDHVLSRDDHLNAPGYVVRPDAVQDVLEAFTQVVTNAEETDSGIQEISSTTDDQAASTEEVVSAVEEVTDISANTADETESASAAAQQQAASMSQVSGNVESLSDQADRLRDLVSAFEVREEEAGTASSTVAEPTV